MSQDIARARELGRQEAERIRAELGTEAEFLGHPDYCSAYHRMRAERDILRRQLSSARDWAVDLEQEVAELRRVARGDPQWSPPKPGQPENRVAGVGPSATTSNTERRYSEEYLAYVDYRGYIYADADDEQPTGVRTDSLQPAPPEPGPKPLAEWEIDLLRQESDPLQAVIDLHSRDYGGQVRYCSVDGEVAPCRTVRAARGER